MAMIKGLQSECCKAPIDYNLDSDGLYCSKCGDKRNKTFIEIIKKWLKPKH